MKKINPRICVIGLGYVGLPLAIAFSKKFKVIGYDININRVNELKKYNDKTNEIKKEILKKNKNIIFVKNISEIKNIDFFVVTVPTPIKNKKPDLKMIVDATKLVAKKIRKKNFVVYESTVYPGVTEDICSKIIENKSKLKLNKDFYIGYSPERINPSDKKRTIEKIIKVTSGSNNYAADYIDKVYKQVIKAGTYKAKSIKIAEAAKVIENTQRDLNIAFINELGVIFNKLNINLNDVLKTAETKWNFLNFKPGLVGGHCIGVDPYYLTYKSRQAGYYPRTILSGRKINDQMAKYIAKDFQKKIFNNKFQNSKKILILGYTFKEDCNDIRNSKVLDLFNALKKNYKTIHVYDPHVIKSELDQIIKPYFRKKPNKNFYDAIIIAVPHKFFLELGLKKIFKFGKKKVCKIYDIKSIFKPNDRILNL
jgi:UDP-N-acetyl-D-galactosamine dehydrogenase